MHLSTLRWSCLCALLVTLPACSDDSNPNPTYPDPDGGGAAPDGTAPDPDAGTGGDGNIDATCDEYARLECARDKACFPIFIDWNYGSDEACLAESKEICLVWSSLPGSGLTAERLVSCLNASVAAGCDAQGPFPECQFLPGALANGGTCQLNDQCGSGYCRREGTSDCGACADKVVDGQACSKATECVSSRCSGGRCAPILKEGDACTDSTDCLRNLVCNQGICEKVTLVGEGQACGGAIACGAYMTCASGRCFKDVIADIGQKCGAMDNAGFALCRKGDCNAQSICVNRPAIGAACSAEGSCAGTAVCVQGQCRALTADVCGMLSRDLATGEGVVRELAGAIGRAALGGRPQRARHGGT